jgi:hypothetical protein
LGQRPAASDSVRGGRTIEAIHPAPNSTDLTNKERTMCTNKTTLATLLTRAPAATWLAAQSANANLSGHPAGNRSHRVPVGNAPLDIPAEDCRFPIHVEVVDDSDYYVFLQTYLDGSVTLCVTGRLVDTFTNLSTGKTIVENISSRGTVVINPEQIRRFDSRGRGFDAHSRTTQVAVGAPALEFSRPGGTGAREVD